MTDWLTVGEVVAQHFQVVEHPFDCIFRLEAGLAQKTLSIEQNAQKICQL